MQGRKFPARAPLVLQLKAETSVDSMSRYDALAIQGLIGLVEKTARI